MTTIGTTNENELQRVVQQVTTSDNEWSASDNEWQRMTTSNKNDNEWQLMTASNKTNECDWE